MKTASQLAWFAALILALETSSPLWAEDDILTTADGILNLSAEEAGRGRRVKLRAVVLDRALPEDRALIVADESAGIYAQSPTNILAGFNRFDLLEITGATSAGEFAPCVQATSARKIGTAPLPAARAATHDKLITGALDAQLIEVAGVVRSVWAGAEAGVWHMRLAMAGGIVPVRLAGACPEGVQVDAEVRLHAIGLHQFNAKRQLVSPILQVPAGMLLQVEKRAPVDPFLGPARPLSSIFQYSRTNRLNHRVHLKGTVTRAQAGSIIWLRDETSGLRIQSSQDGTLEPGDKLEVVGFQNYGSYPPVLEDAVFRRIGKSDPPEPISLGRAEDAYQHEDDLVSLEGRLVAIHPTPDGLRLAFDRTDGVFNATLKAVNGPRDGLDLPLQSVVRVTGICALEHEDPSPIAGLRRARSFSILVNGREDLAVLKKPPLWSARIITTALVAVSAASLLIAGAVALLARRRLKEQQLRRTMAEKEFRAILSERNRLAREIHDTLAQGFTATLVQLRLLKKQVNGSSPEALGTLDLAQELVKGSLDEARASIWNMRSHALEDATLDGALENVLRQMARGDQVTSKFEVTGAPRRLSTVVENNLLRIGQEAITNALKHAEPRHLDVRLHFGERRLLLEVSDDGKGFAPNGPGKGFGLIGMSERAAELKGQLKVQTQQRRGTRIKLSVPLVPGCGP